MIVNINDSETEKENKNINYIQLTEEYYNRDFAGRHTILQEGCYGALLEESDIDTLFNLTPNQKQRCLEGIEFAKKHNYYFALVAGYPCVLPESMFIRKAPISSIVPWEII